MSKQKTQETETDKEVTENLIEQTELEGISTIETDSAAEVVEENPISAEKPENVSIEKPKKTKIEVNRVATAAVNGNKKMGVYKFLSLYPQNVYISTLLKLYYPHSFFTKDEWFMRIDEILNSPINN